MIIKCNQINLNLNDIALLLKMDSMLGSRFRKNAQAKKFIIRVIVNDSRFVEK